MTFRDSSTKMTERVIHHGGKDGAETFRGFLEVEGGSVRSGFQSTASEGIKTCAIKDGTNDGSSVLPLCHPEIDLELDVLFDIFHRRTFFEDSKTIIRRF